MSEKLRVELSGDATELEKATEKASRDLKKFGKVADKSTGSLSSSTNKASKSIKNISRSSSSATPVLQEFSNTVEDAPRNIEDLGRKIGGVVSSFSDLRKSSGSSKNAIKSLTSSLLGSGGILIAVTLVTAGISFLIDKYQIGKSESEKLAEATKKASEALEKFVETQSAANRALIQGQQSAQSELITLGQLRKVVEDTSRSTQDRQKAIQELRRLFPNYFKDLSDEKILTGDLSGVYDELTTSIIARAKATAATNILVKNAEKEIAITARLAQITEQLLKNKERSAQIDKNAALNARGGGNFGAGASSIQIGIENSNLLSEGEDLRIELEKILKDSLDLSDIINTNGGIDLSGVEIKEPKVDKIKIAPFRGIDPDNIKDLEKSGVLAIENLKNAVDKASEKINLDFAEKQLKIGLNRLGNLKIGEETEFEKSLKAFNERVSNLVTGSIVESLSNLGQGIGEAIAQGGNVIQAAGNAILGGLGGFLSKMGQLLIEYGTLGVIKGKLDLAIAAGGPVAIGAGLAAIAVGIALSAAGGALSSAAQGGSSSGGGSTSSGGSSRSQSFSSSSGGGFSGGNVVFEIAGTKLVGVLNRTLARNSALGG